MTANQGLCRRCTRAVDAICETCRNLPFSWGESVSASDGVISVPLNLADEYESDLQLTPVAARELADMLSDAAGSDLGGLQGEWHPYDHEGKGSTAPEHGNLVWVFEREGGVDLGYFDGQCMRMHWGTDDCHVSHWAEIEYPAAPATNDLEEGEE